jgi:predicted DNA-binding protein (MmcQ/YjbR family)
MNKDKWMTALLDGTAGREEIEMLLAVSYELTASRKRRAGR